MNKEWSEQNKSMQEQLKKAGTFNDGIETLFRLRSTIMQVILSFKDELSKDAFCAMPYINAKGYHNKTIAYSLWHIFRIEDIVAHTLINDDEQIFFSGGYQQRINSPIVTTGNELVKQEIADFSIQLNTDELYSYISEVKSSTEKIVSGMSYEMLRKKLPPERRKKLTALNVVSSDENAVWLIDYWCGKDIRGLIQMPFSRHWIMHAEACLRIKDKLNKTV